MDGRDQYIFDPGLQYQVEILSTRDPWVSSENLDLMIAASAFGTEAEVLEIADGERGLVWIDGRFDQVILPETYAIWTNFRKVRIEIVQCTSVRFEHPRLDGILESPGAELVFDTYQVADGYTGLVFESGALTEALPPGRYAFWRGIKSTHVYNVELRTRVLEIPGQELMTSDKVTLRLNATVSFRVDDAKKAVTVVSDFEKALYLECQLALRSLVGALSLDELLVRRDTLAEEITALIRVAADTFGLELKAIGIKDIILPGDMRALLNQVTEAKKAAEASVVTRREETAAIRSQLNTAKLMENSPTLLRLRELETLERVVAGSQLSVVVGDKGLTENVLKLV